MERKAIPRPDWTGTDAAARTTTASEARTTSARAVPPDPPRQPSALPVTPTAATGASSPPGVVERSIDGVGARPRFGDYELIAELARGAMGVIYKARDVRSAGVVALKMIRGGRRASLATVKRFLFEAEAAADLDHPGIVPILEIGERDGVAFYAMAFVEGTNLARQVAENPLPPRRAAELVARVADAVEHAHRRGVVHRDLKPANVLIDAQGWPRITDFGLAKRVEGEGGLSTPGMAVGTPCYMAPEQALGRTDVGPSADIYALGSLLYCLLTSRPPFQAATIPETLRLVAGHRAVPLRRLNPLLPVALETIVAKCLEKEPGRRFATAAEVGDDLNRWLQGRRIHARPIGRIARVVRRWVLRTDWLSENHPQAGQ